MNIRPAEGQTIHGMGARMSMGCAKKCHTVESAGIPFYNVSLGVKGGDVAPGRGPCRIIPKREGFLK